MLPHSPFNNFPEQNKSFPIRKECFISVVRFTALNMSGYELLPEHNTLATRNSNHFFGGGCFTEEQFHFFNIPFGVIIFHSKGINEYSLQETKLPSQSGCLIIRL